MNLLNLQLSALLVLDPLSVILPFLWIFRLEWRYDAHRIAGILSDICLSSVGCFFFPAPASRLFQTRPDLVSASYGIFTVFMPPSYKGKNTGSCLYALPL